MKGRTILSVALIFSAFVLSLHSATVVKAGTQNRPADWFELETRLIDTRAVFSSSGPFLGHNRKTFAKGIKLAHNVAVTVNHLTDDMPCDIFVNSVKTEILRVFKNDDLLFLKIAAENLKLPKFYFSIKKDDEMMILRKEPWSGFEWHPAKVAACFSEPATFCMESDYKIVKGDSGSPVFNREGEFAGIVKGYTNYPPRIIVISASLIYSLMIR